MGLCLCKRNLAEVICGFVLSIMVRHYLGNSVYVCREKEIPLMDRQKPAALSIGYRLEQTALGNLIGISCRFGFFTLFVINLHFSGAMF